MLHFGRLLTKSRQCCCGVLASALFLLLPVCLVGQSLSVPAILSLSSIPEEHHEEPHRHLATRDCERRTPRLPNDLPTSHVSLSSLDRREAVQQVGPQLAAPLPDVHLIGAGVRMRL